MTTCQTLRSEWSDLIDHQLGAERRRELELHLAGCPECRELVADLRRVREWARTALPPPATSDPWLAIARRIAELPAAARPVHRHPAGSGRHWLALAAGLAIAVGLAWVWHPTATDPGRPTGEPASVRLERMLAGQPSALTPETVSVLRESVAQIEAALARAEAALAEDPGDAVYQALLERTRAHERRLFQRVESRLARQRALREGSS